MRLYDDRICEVLTALKEQEARELPVGEAADQRQCNWPDAGRAMMVLQPDMAYELGGHHLPAVGNTLVTMDQTLVPQDEILLYGPDLPEITTDTPYARMALVRVAEDSIGTGDQLYNTIQNIGYFRYHIYPKGFMLRVSSSNDRESVRVAKDALQEGLDFTAIGNAMIRALRLHKEVEAAKIIFVTLPQAPYERFQENLKKTKQITATIDHMLKDVNMDCNSCGLQEICDEVEGLREMHFGIKEQGDDSCLDDTETKEMNDRIK